VKIQAEPLINVEVNVKEQVYDLSKEWLFRGLEKWSRLNGSWMGIRNSGYVTDLQVNMSSNALDEVYQYKF
jgi:hypothetical protein